MKILQILVLLLLTINFTSCVKYESSEKSADLSEVLDLNSNQKILSEINIDAKIEFGYSTITKSYFNKKSQQNTLNVKIITELGNKSITESYLETCSEKINTILKKEMDIYQNFDQLEITLISDGKEIQTLTTDI